MPVGHVGQAGENFTKISKRVKTASPTVFDDGVNDGAGLAGVGITDEEPVFVANGGGANGVFDQVIVNLHPAIIEINFQRAPLAQGIFYGLTQQALRQMASAALESNQRALNAVNKEAALRGAHGLAQ